MSDNPIFSYTKRDYEGARKEGIAKIPIISQGRWTDLNATDPGIIILEYVHALVDMMQYYQDHQALESFISTAKERANIFRLAKQFSYNIRSAKGATCDVIFTSSTIYDYTIKIPKYTRVATMDGIEYLTMQDAYLLAGDHAISVPCTQGILVETSYQGTGISRLSNVVRAANQSIRIIDNNIDIDSITITDSVGREWEKVDYVVFSNATDRAYQVELEPDNSISIKFGDGVRGVVPDTTDNLNIQYIATLAEEGRVDAGSLVILDSNIYDNEGKVAYFSVTNPRASAGGSAVPTSQEIRELAPGAIKAQNRAVTLGDFESLAKLVDGVADAKAYDINTDSSLMHYEVKVLITPESATDDTVALVEKVRADLYKKMIPSVNLQVIAPTEDYIDISVEVTKMDNTPVDRVSYNIEQLILSYMDSRRTAVGESLSAIDLAAEIRQSGLVRTVNNIAFKNLSDPTSGVITNGEISPSSQYSVLKINTDKDRYSLHVTVR